MNKEEEILKLKKQLYLNFNDFSNLAVKEVAKRLISLITNG